VIAEGIEHETQRTRLIELGCGLGQGYLFTRPVGAEAASSMLGGEWAILDSNQGPRPYQRRALTG
jgi:EAL domain-containing protein (putative c-di-GMP-specific phosphodiesterase class I)